MGGKNKSFNLRDKKIGERIEKLNDNLEVGNEMNIDPYKADVGYRLNNKQKGNFYKQEVKK